MIKTIITDVDGVLLIEKQRFSQRYSKRFGIDINTMLPFFDGPFKQCLMGYSDLEVELENVLTTWKWPKSAKELINYWINDIEEVNNDLIKFMNGLKLQVIVATQQEKNRGEALKNIINSYGLKFIDYIGSYAIHKNKKTSEFYTEIMNMHNLTPRETVFIDDDPKNIAGAEQTGINTILHTDNASTIKQINGFLVM